jgi:hypothetical protein
LITAVLVVGFSPTVVPTSTPAGVDVQLAAFVNQFTAGVAVNVAVAP